MNDSEGEGTPSRRSRLWGGPRRWWLLGLPLGAVICLFAGAVAALGMVGFVEYSNSDAFCTSCHEMGEFVSPELQESPHFSNRSGVSASCADCHVPKAWIPKLKRKIQGGWIDIPSHLLGTIETPEKFEAERLRMAEAVWARMRAADSVTCRSCHKQERMDLAQQSRWAQRKHTAEWREKTGETCIDCHQGVAHKLPEMAQTP